MHGTKVGSVSLSWSHPASRSARMACMASLSAWAEVRVGRQPRRRILSMLRRMIGTSPFQPRSPPVYSKRTLSGRRPRQAHARLAISSHRDIITRGNVKCFERATSRFAGEEHSGYDVGDMDIRFALPAVAEDAESCRVLAEPAHEIEPDAMGLPAAHDVAEAEDTASHIEHGAVGGDQRLAGQFTGAVGRDGNKRAMVLPGFHFADLTVDAAARGVQDLPCRRSARMASTTHCVNSVPSRKSMSGSVTARAISGLEAR